MQEIVEYTVSFKNEEGKVFGAIWDVSLDLHEYTAIEFVLGEAEQMAVEENLEVIGMARANKIIFHDLDTDTFNTHYASAFETIDINLHPPHRFRDIASAE